MTYILIDSFNGSEISRHRSIRAAVVAERKHLHAVRRANGSNSYLTYDIIARNSSDIRDAVLDERSKQ